MVTFAQNWQDAAAPGLPADHDRFESVDEKETFLNLGGIPQARSTLLRRREPRGRRFPNAPKCKVLCRCSGPRLGCDFGGPRFEARPRAEESAFNQAIGAAFTIKQSRRAAQSARWECLTSDPKREIIILSGGSQFCSPTRYCCRPSWAFIHPSS